MTFLTATAFANWPVIAQIAWLLGWMMEGIYVVLSGIGIQSVAMCIIVFTVITRMLMLPLTVKQQKSTKMNAVIQPEITAIQKKYAGRTDQQSQQKFQMEQQMVYEKYGVSMFSGCLPSLITIPIMFALYPVVYNMQSYVPQLAALSEEDQLAAYTFLGINLQQAPGFALTPALLIPILSGVFAYISAKLMMVNQPKMDENSSMAGMTKSMNVTMPIMSVFFGITLPAFLGVYWVCQSLVMIIQQYFINRHLAKLSVDDMIKANIEKKNKKRAKQGLPPLSENANVRAKNLAAASENTRKFPAAAYQNKKYEDTGKTKSADDSTRKPEEGSSSGGGSLASKVRMVQDYNEKHKK